MQYISSMGYSRNPARSKKIESQTPTRYTASILFTVGGGLFFFLLGFFLLIVYAVVGGGSHSILNYEVVCSLILGFVLFGFAAHFMDKFDQCERERKKAKLNF